jgi:hypothetical protein
LFVRLVWPGAHDELELDQPLMVVVFEVFALAPLSAAKLTAQFK